MMRARNLLPQLARLRPIPNMGQIESALFLILFGLFMKTVLADHLGSIVERVERLPAGGQGRMPPGMGLVLPMHSRFRSTVISRPIARSHGAWRGSSASN